MNEIYTGFLNNYTVGGYDSVSYFTNGKPVQGNNKYSTTYKETKWLFSNQANQDLFKSDPEKYVPQYGGYCAWAVKQADTAKGDPLKWSVYNGKLYLNYDQSI